MDNSRKRSSDHISDKLHVDRNKSPKYNEHDADADDESENNLDESEQINQLMNEVAGELSEESKKYE